MYDCARVGVCCTESRGARQDQRRLIRQLHDAVSRDDVTAVRQLTTPTSASGTDARAYCTNHLFKIIVKEKKRSDKMASGVFVRVFALTLLVGRQEGYPACKKTEWWVWGDYLSGARCRLACGPDDAIATHCLLLQ